MILEILSLIFKNLKQRKVRTFLTLLGIIIGIAALVGMVGATKGINQAIYEQLKSFRSDWIIVLPGKLKFGFMPSFSSSILPLLSDKDIQAIEKIPGVKMAMGIYVKTLPITYKKETLYLQVWGVDPEKFKQIDTLGIWKGRYLSSKDKYSVIFGYLAANDLFEEKIRVKKKVLIDNKEFEVVGIRNKYGGLLSQTEDEIVIIPLKTMEKDFSHTKGIYRMIVAKIDSNVNPKELEDKVKFALCQERKNCGNEDFFLITPTFVQKTISQISFLLTTMLGGIASISLIVGMIGIANTMYTSVLERTREIGILKAIGFSSRTIMIMFMLESGIIGLIGGIIGIILGYGLGEGFLVIRNYMTISSELVQHRPTTAHMVLSYDLIIESLLLSFFVGILAGVFPARKAAKLPAVEALRYE
ncbi:MAG: hypothetical protein B6U78_00075 [Candidatus Aenigmarchaeota archaeon ex4484_224]|nr:MAG: hypothetical protein B6U78_00075 [Candidatus Aenigmarchaeota archaeon ex4484_224]